MMRYLQSNVTHKRNYSVCQYCVALQCSSLPNYQGKTSRNYPVGLKLPNILSTRNCFQQCAQPVVFLIFVYMPNPDWLLPPNQVKKIVESTHYLSSCSTKHSLFLLAAGSPSPSGSCKSCFEGRCC